MSMQQATCTTGNSKSCFLQDLTEVFDREFLCNVQGYHMSSRQHSKELHMMIYHCFMRSKAAWTCASAKPQRTSLDQSMQT